MTSPPNPKLRVYVVDDHPVVRQAFIRAFEDEADLEVVGQAATAAEAVAGIVDTRPHVVIVDLNLPDNDGPDIISRLREVVPDAKLLVVSAYDDEYRVAEALRAGAHGYLLKTSTLEELVAGVRTAGSGGTPLSARLADTVLRAMRRTGRQISGTIDTLTAREVQVLRLFATGLSTREVAANLGISPKTVETHRIRIYDKLGCRSVVDLARIAVRTGLVQA